MLGAVIDVELVMEVMGDVGIGGSGFRFWGGIAVGADIAGGVLVLEFGLVLDLEMVMVVRSLHCSWV